MENTWGQSRNKGSDLVRREKSRPHKLGWGRAGSKLPLPLHGAGSLKATLVAEREGQVGGGQRVSQLVYTGWGSERGEEILPLLNLRIMGACHSCIWGSDVR